MRCLSRVSKAFKSCFPSSVIATPAKIHTNIQFTCILQKFFRKKPHFVPHFSVFSLLRGLFPPFFVCFSPAFCVDAGNRTTSCLLCGGGGRRNIGQRCLLYKSCWVVWEKLFRCPLCFFFFLPLFRHRMPGAYLFPCSWCSVSFFHIYNRLIP